MVATDTIDLSKVLPPSFFEGLGNTFVGMLSKSVDDKIKAWKIEKVSADSKSSLGESIKRISKDTTVKEALKTIFKNIGIGGGLVDDNKEKRMIQDADKPKTVVIGGFTPEGIKALKKSLPSFIGDKLSKSVDKDKDRDDSKGGWWKIAFGGLALLAGGLYALYKSLESDGPFKGLLLIASKVGVIGGVELLGKAATKLFNRLKTFIGGIQEIVTSIGKFIGIETLEKGAGKEIAEIVVKKEGGSIFTKLLGKIGLFFTKGFLKKVPVIGTAISLFSAWSRFKQGDITGGIIDIGSALAGLLTLIPGVGLPVAIAISTGLDVLNAFLDYKAGGTPAGGGKGKGKMIFDYLGKFGEWIGPKIYNVLKNTPIIGPAIKSFESLLDGDYYKALKQLVYINPVFEIIGSMLGDDEVGAASSFTGNAVKGTFNYISRLLAWVSEKVYNVFKNAPVIGPLIEAFKMFAKGDYSKGLYQLMGVSKDFEILGSLLEDKAVEAVDFGGNVLNGAKDLWDGLIKSIRDLTVDKVKKVVTGSFESAKKSVLNFFGVNDKKEHEQQEYDLRKLKLKKLKEENASAGDTSDSLNDFISRPNSKPVKISSEDTLIGAKSGGPIDKMLNGATSKIDLDGSKLLGDIASNTESTNEMLRKLAEAIFKLATTMGNNQQGVNVYPTMQQPKQKAQALEKTINTIGAVRNEFLTSIYNM